MMYNTSVMQYVRPAETWTEALPIGNGRLGGMVFGSPMEDLISLNEETLWGKPKSNPNNPEAAENIDLVRRLIFDGKLGDAQRLIEEKMIATPPHFPPYEPLGSLRILPIKPIDYTNYSRELDLSSAMARCSFTLDGDEHSREYFASDVDDVIAVHHSTAGAFPRLKITMERDESVRLRSAGSPHPLPGQAADMIGLIDVGPEGDPHERILLMQGSLDGGVEFVVGLIVASDGDGMLLSHHWDQRGPLKIFAAGGSEVTVLITAQTTFAGQSSESAVQRVVDTLVAADARGYKAVRAAHIESAKSRFDRFSLRLGTPSDSTEATPVVVPELLSRARQGQVDCCVATELFVNYCRYLLSSSSRPGGLPSNLQGIWNAERWPTWESDFHPNINLQVNYWPADPLALTDAIEPLAEWLMSTRSSGETTARETYNSRGWTMNHISDAWGFTAPGAGVFGIWPFGGAWLALSLYDHYLYTLDRVFLRDRVYPLLKAAAEFYLDFLIEGPKGTSAEGYLVTVPSNSPENSFYDKDGNAAMVTYGSTMDTMIISHLLRATRSAVLELRRDDPELDLGFEKVLDKTRERLLPVKISPTTNGIQEWAEDYKEVDPGHRHISALYDVFPGRTITPERTPELAAAAHRTIDRKFASGYQKEGWSLGWIATVLARLNDGDGALKCITSIFEDMLFPNLFIEAHMNPQVGDMQGVPTAVLEMLVHSELDEVRLLPALPAKWADGEVSGLRLRGARELAMRWSDGSLIEATIKIQPGSPLPHVTVHTSGQYTIDEREDHIVVSQQ